jgi:sugar phosphate isomerase/epimerase
MNRRQFINRTAFATVGASSAFPIVAKDEVAKRFPIALSQYSLRTLLADGSLTALDFPAFTVDTFGIRAIDLWEGGLPKDKLDDPEYFSKLKARSDHAGTDLFLLMAGAYDCDATKREASLSGILQSLNRAALLDCEFLRVFLRAPGSDETAGLNACVESLKPLVDAAAEKNITIAIEPGASPLSAKGAFLAKVATGLKHPALTLMPDFGKLKDNVYAGTAAMLPHTQTVSCKMHSFDGNGNQPDFDYPRLMKMISESDYSGYLAIEWEGRSLQPVEGVKASQALIKRSLPE